MKKSVQYRVGASSHWPAPLTLITSTLTALGFCAGLQAQEPDIADLQKNIDIFSGVLAEALELEQATGLFGISLGGIDSTYLYGQGVVLEVRTPLSSQRNTLSLVTLTSTLQNMQARSNPFAALSRSANAAAASPPTLALNATNEAEEFYRTMMDRISNVDFSLRINSAIQQASDHARSLRSLNNIDEATYAAVNQDLDALREEMQGEFERLRAIEDELRQGAAASADRIAEADIKVSLDNVLARLEPIRDRAIAKAEELRERSQIAEQEYAARWQQQVAVFEVNLYSAMCDYGSTLHELPNNEHVSVILTGLGADSGESRRTDKVHVFNKSDMLLCQSGEIDAQQLQERSQQYSY